MEPSSHVDIEVSRVRLVDVVKVVKEQGVAMAMAIMAVNIEAVETLGIDLFEGQNTYLPMEAINELGLLKQMRAKGGKTFASARIGGVTCMGMAGCSPEDVFNRKRGSLIARLRLLEDALKIHGSRIDVDLAETLMIGTQTFITIVGEDELHPFVQRGINAYVHAGLDAVAAHVEGE